MRSSTTNTCVLLIGLLAAAGLSFAQGILKPHVADEGHSAAIIDKFSRFRNYTMEHGLSNNWVHAIAQDDDGFMWFGTEEGLSRFDGERFTPFYEQSDGKGLPCNNIVTLQVLPDHRLLIGTEKGLCVLYTRRMEFEPVPLPTRTEYHDGDVLIWTLHHGRNGRIWVGTGTGVHILDANLHVSASFFTPQIAGKPSYNYFAREFLELPDGTVAVKCAYEKGLIPWQVIDFQNNKIQTLDRLLPACGVLDTANALFCTTSEKSNPVLWYTAMGTGSGGPTLYRFDWSTQYTQPVLDNVAADKSKGNYQYPFLLPDSLLLLQRYFGKMLVYDLKTGRTTDLPTWKTSAPDGKSIVNFLDKDGNLWLCPRFEGIFFLSLKIPPVSPMAAVNAEHLKAMDQKYVAEEWFGFNCADVNGKYLISSANGGFYRVDKKIGAVQAIHNTRERLLGLEYVHAFAPSCGDTVWLNTLSGLCWIKTTNGATGLLSESIPGLDSLDNKFLRRDHYGLIWGRVRNNGVGYYDTRYRQFHHFPSQGEHAPFPLTSASVATEDPAGNMWFSFGSERKYFVKWDRNTGVFQKIEPHNTTGLDCTNSQYIMAVSNDKLWVFANRRLFVMDTRSLEVTLFGKKDGLCTDDPNGFCVDKSGNIWFATPYGLSRYDPGNQNLRTFYVTDGLLSNTISDVQLLDTLQNILLVSTGKGICLFYPDKLGAMPPAPATYITALWSSGKPAPLPESGEWALPYYQNDLRIEYTGINFLSGNTNRYQYRLELEGAAEAWKEAGTDNFANFLNLAPGRYKFWVRAANSDGVWSNQQAALSITIYPPFWQTWAFRISVLLLLGGLVWWFYRRQINMVQQREAEKNQVRQQLADLEMKALRAQMNPHFVFNALNSVQNFILKNDTREASRYLTKFARLMRLILENSESPMVPLAREIELLKYYTELECLRFNKRFDFDFQVDPALNPESVSIPGMLIQPHIENAIWHGLMHKSEPGTLYIRFLKNDDNTLCCEIEDNGVGRAKSAELDRQPSHRSTGLANIRNRLELLNAQLAEDIRLEIIDLHDETGAASGTKVVVRMPMIGVAAGM